MKRAVLLIAVLLSFPVFAEYAGELVTTLEGASPAVHGEVIKWVEGAGTDDDSVVVTEIVDAGSPVAALPEKADVAAHPATAMQDFYNAVRTGQGWLAAALLLFAFVGLMRMWGKKLHDLIPDDNILDKPFWFLFDTKVGGWLMNWLTAVGGCLGTAYAAGLTVDAKAWQTAVMASTGATTLIELVDDVKEWWAARKAKTAVDPSVK